MVMATYFAHPAPRWSASNVHPAVLLADKALIVLSVFMMGGLAIFLLTGNTSSEAVDFVVKDSAIARFSWYPLYLFVAIALASYWRSFLKTIPRNPLLYALLAISIASILFSIDPGITLRRTIALVMTVLLGIYLGIRKDRVQTLIYIGIAVGILTFFHLSLIVFLPDLGVDSDTHIGAWKGFLPEKNAFGAMMTSHMIIFIGLFDLDRSRRIFWGVGVGLAAVALIGSQSTTALISALIPLGIYAIFKFLQQFPRLTLLGFYVGVICGFGVAVFTILEPDLLFGLFGKDATLTGRTEVWAMTIDAVERRPWTGYGYSAFWRDVYGPSNIIVDSLDWPVPSAHNAWIEQGLSLGVPGIILLALTTVWALVQSLMLAAQHRNPFPLMLLVQLLILSSSESAILWFHNFFHCVLFVFIVVLVSRHPGEARQR